MKKVCKATVFLVLMLIVSISLTGCDMSKIGDFITKIADVISKIASGIKSFGDSLSGNAGTASDTATIASATTPVATATTPIATDTAPVASDTVTTDTVVIPPATDTTIVEDDAAQVCASNRRQIMGAVEMYNIEHATMMSALTLGTLVNQGYLRAEPKCPEGGTYVAASDLTGNQAAVACSKHGASEDQVGDTEAGDEEDSPGN